MWRELWEKHRGRFLFAVGMVSFLLAGLLARSLPSFRERFLPPMTEPRREAAQGKSKPQPEKTEKEKEELPSPAKAELPAEWYLYITGAVRNPGVYRLAEGARTFHLVEAAGGLNDLADPAAINLAALLADGAHVHVLKKGERERPENAIFVSPVVRLSTLDSSQKKGTAKVNINRASEEELMLLRGIGPALAKRIVEHRIQNGLFKRVDDLLQVKGIGSAKLKGLREQVSLGP
ncbi:MAG: hypothetical protein GX256_01260 [Fretibacterium sp.]|nr:hypothetical protein [Fretibacterium sp.]